MELSAKTAYNPVLKTI